MIARPLRNLTRGTLVAERVATAGTPWSRTVGFLGRGALAAGEGLVFPHCSSVHTIGMRVRLDVIFLDDEGMVMRFVHGARPGRFAIRCAAATSVIELGPSAHARVAVGDVVRLDR